ncbi:MAG: hypothetical protein U0401_27670, partial [Anaerolineae bacterium]
AKQRQELTEEMAPLLAAQGTGSAEENLFWLLADSGELAEEPEFKDIFTDPLLSLPTYISVADELGFPSPDDLFNLPEEEQEDKKADILEEAVRRLLNDELRQEIIEALGRLRERWKKAGNQAEVAKAAAIQFMLSSRKNEEAWPVIGLIQRIIMRSVGAGFELVGATMDDEPDQSGGDESMAALYAKLHEPEMAGKISEAIKKIPGLQDYLEKQTDKIWDEGEEAMIAGELDLEIFTEEELEAAAQIFKSILGEQTDDESVTAEEVKEQFVPAKTKELFTQIEAYLTERMTPERLEQLRARLHTVLDEASYPPKYAAFIRMVSEAMADEQAVENEMGFLLRAILGELRAASWGADDEPEEPQNE